LLAQSFGWRSALYFLAAFAGTVFCMLLFFPDTWRKEVSLPQLSIAKTLLIDRLLAVSGVSEGN
jgi:predicted MFS family arabinose efflux permease